jgi:hypothetical protein
LRLEYRPPGSAEWVPVSGGEIPAVGERSWRPAAGGNVDVRLRASDRAGNWNEAKALVGSSGLTVAAPANPPDQGGQRPPGPPVQIVNSKQISLNYKIEDAGPSGVSKVELWYTRDTRKTWQRYRSEDIKEIDLQQQRQFQFEVEGEGLYGFTLLVSSGVGLSERPPQVGDVPQAWVEVDLTKPVVRNVTAEVGRSPEARTLTIQWVATDKNLGPYPISLSYAEQSEGPWTAMVEPKLENTGRYVWSIPPTGVPWRFFVRVEATDRAGNTGSAQTANPVLVDLNKPKAQILRVEPSGKP